MLSLIELVYVDAAAGDGWSFEAADLSPETCLPVL